MNVTVALCAGIGVGVVIGVFMVTTVDRRIAAHLERVEVTFGPDVPNPDPDDLAGLENELRHPTGWPRG